LGHVAYYQSDYDRAEEVYREVLVLSQQFGTNWAVHGSLVSIAKTACALGQPARATCLLGAAEELRSSMGLFTSLSERTHVDRALASARAALGAGAFASAWADGAALTVEQAVAEAQTTDHAPRVIVQ